MLSRAAVLIALGILAGLVPSDARAAAILVRAGDAGDIFFPLANSNASTGSVIGAGAIYEAPFGFNVSVTPATDDIAPGVIRTFAVNYAVTASAQDGLRTFNFGLDAVTKNLIPGLESFNESLLFHVDNTAPTVTVLDLLGDLVPTSAAGYVLYTPLYVNAADSGTFIKRFTATPLGEFPAGREPYVVELAPPQESGTAQLPPGGGVPDLPSGEWAVSVDDAVGNTSTVTIRVDAKDPVFEIVEPLSGDVFAPSSPVNLFVRMRDEYSGFDYASTSAFTARIDGNDIPLNVSVPEDATPDELEHQLVIGLNAPLAPFMVGDDEFLLTIEVLDRAGRRVAREVNIRVGEDNTPPTIAITEGVSGGRKLGPTPGPFTGPQGQAHWLSNGLISDEGGLNGLRFELTDDLSGVLDTTITRNTPPPLELKAEYPTQTMFTSVDARILEDHPSFAAGEEGPAYNLLVRDRQGNQTMLPFNVDSKPPTVDYSLRITRVPVMVGTEPGMTLQVEAPVVASDDGSGIAQFGMDIDLSSAPTTRGDESLSQTFFISNAPHTVLIMGETTRNISAADAATLASDFNPISLYRLKLDDRLLTEGAGWTTLSGTGEIANWIRRVRLVGNTGSATVWGRWASSADPKDAVINLVGGQLPGTFMIAQLTSEEVGGQPPLTEVGPDILVGGQLEFMVTGSADVGITIDALGGAARRDVPSFVAGPGQNITLNLNGVGVTLHDVSAPGGRVAMVDDFPVTPPPGYRTPPGMPADRGIDLILEAAVNDGISIDIPYLQQVPTSLGQHLKVFHLLAGGGWEDVTIGVDTSGRRVSGHSTSASPFAIFIATGLVPADTAAPATTLDVALFGERGRFIDGIGRLYVSPAATLSLNSVDNDSGVLAVYYAVDPSSTLVATGLNAASAGMFDRYASTLTLSEGRRDIVFGARDRAGNFETLVSSTIYVDRTPPTVTLSEGPGGTFEFDATDPDVAGASSGLSELNFLIDASPESCDGVEESSAAAPGTCANSVYSGPFTLSPGSHTIYYLATDSVGNETGISSVTITVNYGPVVASVSRSSGPIGQPITILGSGFGVWTPPLTALRFGTVAASVSVWNDAQVTATVPGLASGDYPLSLTALQDGATVTASLGVFTVLTPTVVAVAPSSGPIGATFTLDGAAFGPYGGSNTRVLIGGATTPVSIWNDARIVGTVPGTLEPGVYDLSVERQTGDGGLARSNTVYFQVSGIAVSALTPSTGPIGVPFTLTGAGFGAYGGANTQVFFGSTAAAVSVWNDTTIKGTVPSLSTGAYAVVVRRAQGGGEELSLPTTFTLTELALPPPVPSSAPIGAPFTLTGSGFGPYAGANTRLLLGGATVAVSVWNDAVISGVVPAVAAGIQSLWIERRSGAGLQSSNTAYFEVLTPVIASLSPSSGAIGAIFTLAGHGFGPYGGANTRVLLGGATAAVSVWNDATIKGTVPGSLPTGTYPLLVERAYAGALSRSATVEFQVVGQFINSVTPSSGPVGVPFTVTGAGFGAYGGANTRVLFSGTTAPVSVWNDSTITGTIPLLTPGAHAVTVERVSGSGLSMSNAGAFTLTELVLTAPTPSSGPAGVSFTLNGAGFGPYAVTNTRLLLGGATVPVSVWNDTTITGTVLTLPAGAHPLWLERRAGTGLQASNTVYFEVLTPTVNALTPSSGAIGVPFTLTGAGFGTYGGANTLVLFGTVTAAVSVWNDTTIKGTVPALEAGEHPLLVRRLQAGTPTDSEASTFTVLALDVQSVEPSSAPIGAPFTLTGTAFGPYAGANTRVKFGGVVAPISVWNDSTIKGTVPGVLSTGTVSVVVERAVGAAVSAAAPFDFAVLLPTISSITPSFGPTGTVVTVTGHGFGPYAGAATRLLVGGSTVTVSVWNDATIRWTVPASLPDGPHEVIVARHPAGGSVSSAPVEFTKGTTFGPAALSGFSALSAQPDMNFEGGLNLPAEEGGRVETPAQAAVTVPPGALEADAVITVARDRDSHKAARAAALAREGLGAAGEPIEFGPEGTRFSVPVTIELPYDPSLFPGGPPATLAVHYFDPAARTWTPLPTQVDAARRVLIARTDHFSLYQPLAPGIGVAAVDDFGLRDHYAFPNPSRSGAAVTFRVQPGLADSVEVRVYDLAGRKIHSSSNFALSASFDDGNGKGAQHTYDHVWNVSGVASGVYHYVIVAKRAGRGDVTTRGKVGVIK